MTLIICNSMFQLFTAVVIRQTFLKEKKVDLLLTDATSSFAEMSKKEKLRDIFDNVMYTPVLNNIARLSRMEKSHYFSKVFNLFPKYYVKRVWKIDTGKYDELFFSLYQLFSIRLAKHLKRKNKASKIHLFEDGISTYLIDDKTLGNRNVASLNAQALIDDIYLFAPDLMCLETSKPLITIPKIDRSSEIAELLNMVFGDSAYEIREKFIFFEESFNNDGYTTNDAELIELLRDTAQSEFIIKHHPRNAVNRFAGKMNTLSVPILWEQYILNHSIENKVIVTVSSNTAFVPQIICGSCPYVVFLYKIFNGTSPILQSGNFENYVAKYVSRFKEYADKKIFFPETIEEYKDIIQKLL